MSKIEKISSMNKPHNKQKPKEKVNGKQQNDNEFQQRCEQYRHSLKVQIKDNDEIKPDKSNMKQYGQHTRFSPGTNYIMQQSRLGLNRDDD